VTYSIVARDAETGELGVGVQSRAFNTGAACAWARPGAGAVATQSFTERSYGPLGLDLMAAGKSPERALAGLVAADPDEAWRQVGCVSAAGETATHTGASCIADAGSARGDGWTAQANMCRGAVWEAMGPAFEAATGSLARRLLAALDAAEAAGGDFRGRQAGGLLVVPAEGQPWARVIDLRVDDHPEPLAELRRLLDLAEAYRALNRRGRGEPVEPLLEAARAAGAPADELDWHAAVAAWRDRDPDEARRRSRGLAAAEPRWAGAVESLLALEPPE
jgi:uncharacterized Ntn-hydrolase superfamily protein